MLILTNTVTGIWVGSTVTIMVNELDV